MRSELGRTVNKEPQQLTKDPIVEDVANDTWMDFSEMSAGLSRTRKLVLKLRADWFTETEIAKVVGLSPHGVKEAVKGIKKDQKLRKCL
jgi:hypothetical protein